MKRALAAVVSLILIAVLVTVLVGHFRPTDHVYMVADVQVGLWRDPQAWIGRTVLIRGLDEQIGLSCAGSTRTIVDSHCRPAYSSVAARARRGVSCATGRCYSL